MPEMDIIIVSNGRSQYLQNITKNAIQTCQASSNLIQFNFIIIEQSAKANYTERNTKTIHYDFAFNYNRCLNLGLKHSTSKFVALCNNDLDFKRIWAEEMIIAMADKYLSGSPAKRRLQVPPVEGYGIAKQINGWCIVINRAILKEIGKLDEGVRFWYSDNIYADQLRAKGIKHILVHKSAVRHLHSVTLKVSRNGRDLMSKQYNNYKAARKKYVK